MCYIKELKNLLNWLFILMLTFAFLLSGISNDVRNITHVVAISAIAVGFGNLLIAKSKIRIPPHFTPLLIFIVILQIYWIFTDDKSMPFYYALLFTEGLSIWFITYNLDKKMISRLPLVFVAPSVIYSFFYLFSNYFDISLTKLATLYFFTGNGVGHQQIGNLWAIALVFLVAGGLSNSKYLYSLILSIMAVYFIFISKSRTAFLSILIPLITLYSRNKSTKKMMVVASLIIILLIFYVSMNRSILLSRPYFIQSLMGFFDYPLGVGMGNFRQISDVNYFSDATHNIFLEAVSGVGILAVPFLYWGYKIITNIITDFRSKNIAWVCTFLVISLMFFVDLTYVIPGMFWLWFIALGAAT